MQEQREAVGRMQAYIEEHLDEKIGLNELSSVSGFSPWHAHRLFTMLTGLAPAEYIRKLRLSKSALQLRDEAVRVTDVAFAMGYGSVDGYQRAFREEFGMNPSSYAGHPVPLPLFIPYGVNNTRKEKRNMEKQNIVYVSVIEEGKRNLIVKRGKKATDYWTYGEEVGCDVWGILKSMDDNPLCLWLPERFRKEGTSTYVQGVVAKEGSTMEMPEGFDTLTLPSATYLRFQGEPFEEQDFEESIMNVQNAIKHYDPENLGYIWDDTNPRIQMEPIGMRGYIELRAVRKK